jgi:hypothetical protein
MKQLSITVPELLVLRNLWSLASVGFGLLLADRLRGPRRRAAGWAMLASAVAIGIPFAVGFAAKLRSQAREAPEPRLPQPQATPAPGRVERGERVERSAEMAV